MLNDLTLLQAGQIYGLAYQGKLLYAFRLPKGHLASVSAPLPPGIVWSPLARGQVVHDLAVRLGIFDVLVARLGKFIDDRYTPAMVRRSLRSVLCPPPPGYWQ